MQSVRGRIEARELLDIGWVLACAVLVITMQAGFCCLESGLVRNKNSINVAAKNIVDFCVASVCFWLIGSTLVRSQLANSAAPCGSSRRGIRCGSTRATDRALRETGSSSLRCDEPPALARQPLLVRRCRKRKLSLTQHWTWTVTGAGEPLQFAA
ncbi:MAG: hypothetical protein ABIP94_24135 [Planctomycetota bacterium]